MTTDSKDHMWIGTYGGGLKRYDGLNVETIAMIHFLNLQFRIPTILIWYLVKTKTFG